MGHLRVLLATTIGDGVGNRQQAIGNGQEGNKEGDAFRAIARWHLSLAAAIRAPRRYEFSRNLQRRADSHGARAFETAAADGISATKQLFDRVRGVGARSFCSLTRQGVK